MTNAQFITEFLDTIQQEIPSFFDKFRNRNVGVIEHLVYLKPVFSDEGSPFQLRITSGCTRAAIIFRKRNLVLKWDLGDGSSCHGNCEAEVKIYPLLAEVGLSKYIVKTTRCEYRGHAFYYSQKVNEVAANMWGDPLRCDANIEEERRVINLIGKYISDLHVANFGYTRRGNLKVFDYASLNVG